MHHTIGYVESIGESRNQVIKTGSDISTLVEKPLLKACEHLYDMNIKTLESKASSRDVQSGYGSIAVDYDSLSYRNKAIAQRNFSCYESGDGINIVEIGIPIESSDTSVDEISRRALEEAGKFEHQSMTWAPKLTFQDILKLYDCTESDGFTPEDFVKQGYFYDANSEIFYLSQEHYRKSNPRIKVLPQIRVVEN